MTKTVRKIFFLWEYEKEEAWINRMANEGWMLIHTGFRKYVFEKELPVHIPTVWSCWKRHIPESKSHILTF